MVTLEQMQALHDQTDETTLFGFVTDDGQVISITINGEVRGAKALLIYNRAQSHLSQAYNDGRLGRPSSAEAQRALNEWLSAVAE